MSARGTRAIDVLRGAGIAFTVHEYDRDPAEAPAERGRERGGHVGYGEATVAALGLEPARVFKTLVATVDGSLVVGVVPVAGELDLKRLAASIGGRKAAMADPAEAERATGYVVGGISPLGGRRRLPVVVDESATAFATVFVSGGRRALQVELAPADLVRLTGAKLASIARRSPG